MTPISSDKKLKLIDKVQKLMRLATSNHEGEAALAMERAGEILAKYGLSMADVEAQSKKSDLKFMSVEVNGDRVGWIGFLAQAVSELFDTRAVRYRGSNTRKFVFRFIGFLQDVELSGHYFEFLYRQINERGREFKKNTRCSSNDSDAYFWGISQTVVRRLGDANRRRREVLEQGLTPIDPETGLPMENGVTGNQKGLVVFKREFVDKWVDENLTVKPSQAKNDLHRDSYAAFRRGVADGHGIRIQRAIG